MHLSFCAAVCRTVYLFISLLSVGFAQDTTDNLARRGEHPYVEPSGNRQAHPLAGETVNETRVYDFYQRQADYYMAGATMPDILPAFPGLDAGEHGHWGKHNQNNHEDGRWNDIDFGPLVTQVFRVDKNFAVLKGMSVRLRDTLSACFDPVALSYRCIWQDGFVQFHPFRWGTSRNASPAGDNIWFTDSVEKGWSGPSNDIEYFGNYRDGSKVTFHYRIGTANIFDRPGVLRSTAGHVFRRTIDFRTGAKGLRLRGGTRPTASSAIWLATVQSEGSEPREIETDENGDWWIEAPEEPARIVFSLWQGSESQLPDTQIAVRFAKFPDEMRPVDQARPLWPNPIKMPGSIGDAIEDSAYAVDTLNVPYDNPWKVVMQLSGIGFLPDGSALVSTLSGDVWKVSGIDDSLQGVTWKRYATGFNQPLGIHIDKDGVFVLDRGQITRLHDLNDDDEADFYENYANDFGGYNRSHSHTFGLARTADGAFTFVQREEILRTSPDRKTSRFAWGVRNCMGVGGSEELVFVAPQEGTWTPASMIIEVNRGEFYGLPIAGDTNPNIATPLCYIPRGVDNSTGGIVEVTSDRWGPLQKRFIGISYGSGIFYLILRDDTGPRPQGAIVPLEGEFLSGTMRGAFRPQDGQLYVVGMDGWGDYAARDGCLHRVRYTSKPLRKPTGFQVHENGIRIDFPIALDSESAGNIENYFVHQWNYEYAKRYGSPEFSQRHAESLGHDPVQVRSIVSLNEGHSIFLEIPQLEPVMQMHIRMHLRDTDGVGFKTDLFPSILHLGQRLENPNFAPPVTGKPTTIALRIRREKEDQKGDSESGESVANARQITINAIGGLQYEQKSFTVKAGQAISLKLVNKDVMPHNLVIVKPGTEKSVGDASFAMLNDPDAGTKHYVPDTEDVIAYTFVINPNATHTLNFVAPTKPGSYPYMCTFPGHWMAMRGIV